MKMSSANMIKNKLTTKGLIEQPRLGYLTRHKQLNVCNSVNFMNKQTLSRVPYGERSH